MKASSLRIFCLHLLIMLAFVAKGAGQGCRGWMQPGYSTYESQSTDWTYIYTSVVVDGTTTGTCPFGCGCSGVQHYGQAYNKVGSVGGWVNGPAGPWDSYVSVQNNQRVTDSSGVDIPFSAEGDVICTAVGTIFQVNLPTITAAIAMTKEKTTAANQKTYCPSAALCSNTATPKCVANPIYEGKNAPCHPAHNCEFLALRTGTSGPYNCTVNVCIGTFSTTPSNSCTPAQ